MDKPIDFNNVSDILQELNNMSHYISEVSNQWLLRYRAEICKNELHKIYYLTESHALNLRILTALGSNSDYQENTAIKCANSDVDENISQILKQIQEMPEEWTLIQLTSENTNNLNNDNSVYETAGINIVVFKCGKKESKPFLVSTGAPVDEVNGNKINILSDLHNTIKESKERFRNVGNIVKNTKNINIIAINRQNIEDRLQHTVQDMQDKWLKEWKCLLTGKLVNAQLEKKIKADIKNYFKKEAISIKLTERIVEILSCLVKGGSYLNLKEFYNVLSYCFPDLDKTVVKSMVSSFKSLSDSFNLKYEKKHPIILILDDALDICPWEMINILETQSVSRLPSLHYVYTLFKTHEKEIENGHKILTQYEKGSYIVNPDKNLASMEIRMMNFFNYWCPNWTGISGYKPTNEEFFELLTTSDIFCYNGHGNGSQHMTTERLQKTYVKAVVLLFGCSSVKIERLGPQVGYQGNYNNYLIARCPCVVGMLWEVSDTDTDMLTSQFLSQWIPSTADVHWKHVNKTDWKAAHRTVKFVLDSTLVHGNISVEPELCRALGLAKKDVKYFGTKAACVVRGIPVKIKSDY